MKIIGFGGPSLAFQQGDQEGQRDVDGVSVHWLPPAELGDFLTAVHRHRPDVVLLADIQPWPSLSVWHKEIIWALSHGIHVVGTGAGGAIRAAELSFCGMQGHGAVYDMFRSGYLEDDAAVLCAYTAGLDGQEGGYQRLSEPFVNILATLEQPEVEKLFTGEEKKTILDTSKSIFFQERTRPVLLEKMALAGLAPKACQNLRVVMEEAYVDQQALDVRDTLRCLADPDFLGAPPSAETMPIPVNESTTLFRNLYDRDRKVHRDSTTMRLYELGDYCTTHCDTIETDSYNALNRELTLVLAEKLDLDVSDGEIDACSRRFRQQHGLQDDTDWQFWLEANDLNEWDAERLMREEALVRKLQKAFFVGHMYQRNTRPLLDFMRLQNTYTTWRDKAFDREEKIDQNKDAVREAYMHTDVGELLYHKQSTDPLPWQVPVQQTADSLGIGAKSFIIELLKDKLSEVGVDEQVHQALLDTIEHALD